MGAVDLITSSDGWLFRIRVSEWRPEKALKGVFESTHTWTLLSGIEAVSRVGSEYGTWHIVFNNCNNFAAKVVEDLREKGPVSEREVETDLEKFLRRAGSGTHRVDVTMDFSVGAQAV